MKLEISNEWTPRERLQVIDLLSAHLKTLLKSYPDMAQPNAQDFNERIQQVVAMPASWLNKNTGGIFEGMGIEIDSPT